MRMLCVCDHLFVYSTIFHLMIMICFMHLYTLRPTNNPIQFNPIQFNSNPLHSNPIQSNAIKAISLYSTPFHFTERFTPLFSYCTPLIIIVYKMKIININLSVYTFMGHTIMLIIWSFDAIRRPSHSANPSNPSNSSNPSNPSHRLMMLVGTSWCVRAGPDECHINFYINIDEVDGNANIILFYISIFGRFIRLISFISTSSEQHTCKYKHIW